MMAENLIYTEGGCHHFSESKKQMKMKKMTRSSLVLALFCSSIMYLKASSWENPKTVALLLVRIDTKINELTKEKAQNQVKLEATNGHFSEKQKDKMVL